MPSSGPFASGGPIRATFIKGPAKLEPPSAEEIAEVLGTSEPLPVYSGEPLTFYRDESAKIDLAPMTVRFRRELLNPLDCAHEGAAPVVCAGVAYVAICVNCHATLPAGWISADHYERALAMAVEFEASRESDDG